MSKRVAALVIAALDTLGFLFALKATWLSGSDAATKGLDNLAALAITALFAVTAPPALYLSWRNRRAGLALTLALLFPAVFVVLFIGAVIMFSFK